MFGARSRDAFTLVEVVTALFIIMVGIMGGYDLVNQSIVASKSISMRMTAAYLGKEGIEIAKSVRDGNYLKIHYGEDGDHNWVDGLGTGGVPPLNIDCSSGCIGQYNSDALSNVNTNQPLKYSPSTGFYAYTFGGGVTDAVNTVYQRKITITVPSSDVLEVRVAVSWFEHGNSHLITVRENIYNWWDQ